MSKKQTPEETAAAGASGEDTEGQSMAALLAMRQLTKSPRAAAKADETLPRLTKKFPRLRDDGAK
jgi:hypothetical protein